VKPALEGYVVPLQGANAVCWRVTSNFLGSCLLHSSVLWLGSLYFVVMPQKLVFAFCGPCLCNLRSVVPLLGAIVMSYGVSSRRIRWFCEI